MTANRAVLGARVEKWVKEQTPGTLERRRQAAMRRFEAEDPHQRVLEGFDYLDEYKTTLKGFAVFESTQVDVVPPGARQADEPPSLHQMEDANSGVNPAGEGPSQARLPEAPSGAPGSIGTGSIAEAKEMIDDLATGYFHRGLGGGASVDHVIHATLDLLNRGFDREVSVNLGMHLISLWLNGLAEQWEQEVEPLKKAVDRQRSESEKNSAT